MLTDEGRRDRDWRGFPLLRQLLESLPAPTDRRASIISTAESMFERLGRLMRIAALAGEHREQVLALANSHPDASHAVAEELHQLRGELGSLRHAWDNEISQVERLLETVWQGGR